MLVLLRKKVEKKVPLKKLKLPTQLPQVKSPNYQQGAPEDLSGLDTKHSGTAGNNNRPRSKRAGDITREEHDRGKKFKQDHSVQTMLNFFNVSC
jgi:hypothetical protein